MKSRKTVLSLATTISILTLSITMFTGCQNKATTSTDNTTQTTTTTNTQPVEKKGGKGPGMSSLDTSAVTTKYLDLAYASVSDAEKLDIYLPNSGEGPFPVIVAIHGGAFKSGDKASGETAPMLKALERGYAVVAVNYRLSGEAQFPAQINDIKAAIRFIRANASKYNLNGDKVATWGGSAGGSLSALAGTSGGDVTLEGAELGNSDQSSQVQATVDWFGPIYFSTMDEEFAKLGVTPAMGSTSSKGSPESAYLGKTVGTSEAEELVEKASPQTYISAEDPAFLIQHGTSDGNIPITQSENFAAKLKAVIGNDKVTFEKIEGAGHGGSQFETTENISKVLDFLDKYMK
jgi:acetyl esterase/lipase